VRAAAIQLNSNADKQRNIEIAERLVRRAAGAGAELLVLPEKFNVLGTEEQLRAGAEELSGPTLTLFGKLAAELAVWIVVGSIVEQTAHGGKLHNTSALVGPDGEQHAVYRKIHLFDVEVEGVSYRESDAEAPGSEVVVADADELPLGLAICYDLRFPEIFRIMALRGARAFPLPAAFTVPTGRAHWEVLTRARAIENLAFVVAAGQVGRHPPDHESFGHSLIVDPWGVVLAGCGVEPEQVVLADLDMSRQDAVREKLPALQHRKPGAYAWPEAVEAAT
jgi:predicted amidohydrolase